MTSIQSAPSTFNSSKHFRAISETFSASKYLANKRTNTYKRHETINERNSSSISLEGFPANSCIGSGKHMCQSGSEYKAYKMNRKEECKLGEFCSRVDREQILIEKQHVQTTQMFRAKSAKLLREDRLAPKKENTMCTTLKRTKPEMPSRNQRPFSSPAITTHHKHGQAAANLHGAELKAKGDHCSTCRHINNVIETYEKHAAVPISGTKQKIELSQKKVQYLFSDRQVKTFLNLLETNYCSGIPAVTEIIHNGVKQHHNIRAAFHTDDENAAETVTNIESRINTFCKEQDKFNKEHPLPEHIKSGLEKVRRAQAMLVLSETRQRTRRSSDARQKLNLRRKGKIFV